MKQELKILDTDIFFNDSSNAGEPECKCSRCHRHINEHERVYRVPIDETMFFARLQGTSIEREAIVPHVNGFEFRLCLDCFNKYVNND